MASAPAAVDPLATTPQQRSEFARLLTGGRMNSYASAVTGGDSLELYAYNMALAAAYLGPLHILEVVARNAMHAQLTAYTGRSDWWDSPKVSLVKRQEDDITEAENNIDRKLGSSRARTADDVVAALSFGFWCGLLGKGDPQTGYQYERQLWQPALRKAFPGHRSNRGALHTQFDDARTFRNRITHHEPVHTFDIAKTANTVTRLIYLVSPPVSEWVTKRSRLRYVANNPPGSASPLRTF